MIYSTQQHPNSYITLNNNMAFSKRAFRLASFAELAIQFFQTKKKSFCFYGFSLMEGETFQFNSIIDIFI